MSVNANAVFGTTASSLQTQIVSGPLRSVADGKNGVFGSAAGVFPTSTWSSTNYFVDASVVPDGDPGPLGVVTTTPAANATSVSTLATVKVKFSRPVLAGRAKAECFGIGRYRRGGL